MQQTEERIKAIEQELEEELDCVAGLPCEWYTYMEYREMGRYISQN